MKKLSVNEARKESAIGSSVKIQGWVRTRRDSKAGFSFIELNDGSSQGNIQIVAPGELTNYESDVKALTCLLYTSPSPRDATLSRMPSSA